LEFGGMHQGLNFANRGHGAPNVDGECWRETGFLQLELNIGIGMFGQQGGHLSNSGFLLLGERLREESEGES
jgi:hypothetical protein